MHVFLLEDFFKFSSIQLGKIDGWLLKQMNTFYSRSLRNIFAKLFENQVPIFFFFFFLLTKFCT